MKFFLRWLAITVAVSLVVGWWLFRTWGTVIFDDEAAGFRQYAHLVGVLIIVVTPIVYFLHMLSHIVRQPNEPREEEPRTWDGN